MDFLGNGYLLTDTGLAVCAGLRHGIGMARAGLRDFGFWLRAQLRKKCRCRADAHADLPP